MVIKLGITGGIGSGKSVISELLRIMEIPVYDSDHEAKKLTEHDTRIKEKLSDIVGKELYANDVFDKKMLASYIFGNETHLKEVNNIIHPAVKQDFIRWANEQTDARIVGFESAILIDAGFADTMDYIVTVTAPTEIRIRRAVQRDQTSARSIKQRIKSQLNDEERIKKSDFVIVNDDATPLIPQVLSLVAQLSPREPQTL